MLRKTCSSQRFAHSMSYSAPDGGVDVDEPPRTRRRASMPLMTTNAGTTYGEPEPQVKSHSCLLDPEMPVRRSPCSKRRESFWSHQGTSQTLSSGRASVAAGTMVPFLKEHAPKTPETPSCSGLMNCHPCLLPCRTLSMSSSRVHWIRVSCLPTRMV